jgi:hypothetical protein
VSVVRHEKYFCLWQTWSDNIMVGSVGAKLQFKTKTLVALVFSFTNRYCS